MNPRTSPLRKRKEIRGPNVGDVCRDKKIRTIDEEPKFGREVDDEIGAERERDAHVRRRETHLVCHGSLNPDVQYVYHCTTHVPYSTAYTTTGQVSVMRHPEQNEDMNIGNSRWRPRPRRWAPRSDSYSPCWPSCSIVNQEG